MTYCVAIKLGEGLIGLSDGRITSGIQLTTARKLTLHGPPGARFMLMSAGLRSVRDKAVAYLEREMRARPGGGGFRAMLDAVVAFAAALRQAAAEDKKALEEGGFKFDLQAILGGQLADDPEPTLFLVYPEGNWVQVDARTPYLSIGQTAYGKPIIDRALTGETSMAKALKIAYLSFDSTRVSSATVGFPLDVATWSVADRRWREVLLQSDDLAAQRAWWNGRLTQLVDAMPDGPWTGALLPPTG